MKSYITLKEMTHAVELYFNAEDPNESSDYLVNCLFQPDRLSPGTRKGSDSQTTTNK